MQEIAADRAGWAKLRAVLWAPMPWLLLVSGLCKELEATGKPWSWVKGSW